MNKRLGLLYEGATAPSASHARTSPDFWLDTSGEAPVLKIKNKDGKNWIAIDVAAADVSAVTAKLTALDGAATALTALATNLDATVAKADIDDAGTIDGTEIAAALSATNARVNEVAVAVNALVTALKVVG